MQNRINEIEAAVATGTMDASQCFTQMRQLLPPNNPYLSEYPIKPVCDALITIVTHSGNPEGMAEALKPWRTNAEALIMPGKPQAIQLAAEEKVGQCPNCLGTNKPSQLDPQWHGRCECNPAYPAEEVVAAEFFAYDSECGFETFNTEAEAKKYAQDSIDSYREEAAEGWPEEVESVRWGVVLGTTKEVPVPNDGYDGSQGVADAGTCVDYVLTEYAAQQPAPDGVPKNYKKLAELLEHENAVLRKQLAAPVSEAMAQHRKDSNMGSYALLAVATPHPDFVALYTHPAPDDVIARYGYQRLFNAIGDATQIQGKQPGQAIAISVLDFAHALTAVSLPKGDAQ